VTFVASTGDNGSPAGYPAYSSNVLAVGGTTLNIGSSGNYVSETGWSDSGGGISQYEAQPAYQNGVVTQTSTQRAAPDVAFDADPNTGVPSTIRSVTARPTLGTNWWNQLWRPSWAAIIAIADQDE